MSQLTQSQELGATLAQLGVDVPAPTFWQGLTSAPIQLQAIIPPAAYVAGQNIAIADALTGQRISNAAETARWRGIVTAVDVILSPDVAATNLADSRLFLDNSELRLLGPGGELRIPLYSALRVAPGTPTVAVAGATTITGCPTGGNGVYRLARSYWLDTETTENIRVLTPFVSAGVNTINVILHGVFAMNTKSRSDTYKDVTGVDPTGRDCQPNAQFISSVAKIIRRQAQPALASDLMQG